MKRINNKIDEQNVKEINDKEAVMKQKEFRNSKPKTQIGFVWFPENTKERKKTC